MWSWSKLSANKWEDVWAERIAGNPNAVITAVKGGKTIRVTVYCAEKEDADTLQNYFGGSIREIKSVDWVAAQNLKPRPELRIRQNLVITDQHGEAAMQKLSQKFPERALISIPAEMAFGTGDHATTSTCLRFISDFASKNKGKSWKMADIGCGTAILAIAALKLGAEHALAYDFDSIAVDVSRDNALRNEISAEQLDLFVADVFEWKPSPAQKSQLVVANLFSSILQRAFPHIIDTMETNATLIISGILATQWEATLAAAQQCGIEFPQVIKKGKWVTACGGLK